MNVLHINSNYLTSRLHENLMDQIETKEIHNTVFMPIKKEKKSEFLYESKHKVLYPLTFTNRDKYIFTWKQNKIYKKLKSTVKLDCFDLTHAHTLFTDGNVAYNIKKNFDIPYIVTVRGYTDIHNFFKKRVNLRNKGRKILADASKIIFLSETNRKDLLKDYIKDDVLKENIISKSIILPNGIDDFWFENCGHPKTLDDTTPIKCLYVGKIMKDKNVHGLIESIRIFNQKSTRKATLLIVGEDYEPDYAQYLKANAPNFVTFNAKVSRETLIDYYRNNDIFLMPSFHETFGLVYPEAMSQGLPVVYAKNQGFDGKFGEGEIGYAVKPKDPNDIADKISEIVNNYDAISKNALSGFKKFNWNQISKKYVELYKNFID